MLSLLVVLVGSVLVNTRNSGLDVAVTCARQTAIKIQLLNSEICGTLVLNLQAAVWPNGVVSADGRINEVNLRRARLVLIWVTRSRACRLSMYSYLGQLSLLPSVDGK